MNSNLQILFFLTIFLFTAHSSCPSGYFTNNSPCDTKATLLKSTKYTSHNIGPSQWHYYYMPLAGIDSDDNFGLSFQAEAQYLEAFMDFQRAGQYQLPDYNYFDYAFYVQDGDRTIPYQILTYGMENKENGKMLLGIYNPYSSPVNVRIQSFTAENNKSLINSFVIGIIITAMTVIFAIICLAVIVHRLRTRRREIMRGGNIRLESEAQGILITSPANGNQNNVKSNDALTLEEFQKYFPKQQFGKIENHFQQAGCAVCLDDFSAEIECYQLYCNHIFHEACIQTWLEKQNNCPACRVPLGKKAIEEFFEAQKKQTEVNRPENIEINIQDQQVANEQENNDTQTPT